MSDDLRDRVLAYLREHTSMVFTSSVHGAQVASTTCYVADDDLTVYGFVFRGSEKYQAIDADSPVALIVDDGFRIPMRGVELYGRAEFVEDEADARRAQELLQATFPKLANVWGHPAVALIRVRPERIVFIDWTEKLGHSETLELAA